MLLSSLEDFSLPLAAEAEVEGGLSSPIVEELCRVFVLRAKTCLDQDGVSLH